MDFFDINPAFSHHTLIVTDDGQTLTYGDWYEAAASLQSVMKARTLAFIRCCNTPGSVLAYLCCLQNRIVPLLVDDQMNDDLLNRLIDAYQPAWIFQPQNQAAPARALKQTAIYDYDLYHYNRAGFPLYENLALLLTTSGSTGSPKLVRQSYGNIQANAVSIASYLELTEKDRPVTTLPMHYTFGLSVINSHVLQGAAIYLTERTIFEPTFWQFCRDQAITSLAGVPFTYECLKKLRFCRMELPALTLLIQAGGKLSRTLHEEYAHYAADKGKRFIVMYGQTEATARMSYLPANCSLAKIGSIGIAIPGGTFHIMEDDTTEITVPFQKGELRYDGPNVTLGYAHNGADLCRGDERQGRLMTGDIAYVDDEGFYYIAGRKKRFIKLQGKRINLDEVEQLFKNAFTDCDFACTGVDERLYIFTTASEKAFEAYSTFLMDTTGLHPALYQFLSIEVIPKNSSGKTQYTELEQHISRNSK